MWKEVFSKELFQVSGRFRSVTCFGNILFTIGCILFAYGSLIWNPNYQIHSDNLGSVQKQFSIFALRHFWWNSMINLLSCTNRLKPLNLATFASHWEMLGVLFVAKLLHGSFCSSWFLPELKFNGPARVSRQCRPLLLMSIRTTHWMSFSSIEAQF